VSDIPHRGGGAEGEGKEETTYPELLLAGCIEDVEHRHDTVDQHLLSVAVFDRGI
jgi:hypothetical protein